MPKPTTWAEMHAAARRPPRHLTKDDVPSAPGVYAWYRGGTAIYVGKADSLVPRVWANHLGNSRSISGSAFRRNVAESLGIASAADIKSGRYAPTDVELVAVRAWIMSCEIAWLTFVTKEAAQQASATSRPSGSRCSRSAR
jgi:hypothetical protein